MKRECVEDAAADQIPLRGAQHPGRGGVGELHPSTEIQRAETVTQGIEDGAQPVFLLVGVSRAASLECLVEILHLARGDLERALE